MVDKKKKRNDQDPGKRPALKQQRRGFKPSSISKTSALWVLIFVIFFAIWQFYSAKRTEIIEISYSDFLAELERNNVESVVVIQKELKLTGQLKSPSTSSIEGRVRNYLKFATFLPYEDQELLNELKEKKDVLISSQPPSVNWSWQIINWLPWLLILGLWLFFIRQMQGGGSKAFSFGKSKAKLLTGDTPKVTFEDVAGADEAKQELEEIIDFLKDPRRFQKLGGRLPKGALLLGPPGTGKTLLAKAVAGEAGVPFFSMSGSDFVEMFVGVGASRVRDLFDQGKSHAPCIIFIDELDAVGRHRGAGLGGGHDEREQTLNQLLVEMDGFESNEGVILLAATNRPDVLDPALLRPGRFDRQIVVDRPDVRGREGVFRVHTRKIPLAKNVDLKVLAQSTPGLSGAELANIVNEAALLAARNNGEKVTMRDFDDAKDKVMLGAERKSLVISDHEKRLISVHEAGHTLVRKLTPTADPVQKVTIIPRGRALGVTHYLPVDDRHIYSRTWCEDNLVAMLGGRAAELIIFEQLTTGAGDDLEKATELARMMVCSWGMSEEMGPLTFGKKEEQIFLGREIAQHRDYSEATAVKIDKEVQRIVETADKKAHELIADNLDLLRAIADALLEREILEGFEIDMIMEGKKLKPLTTRTKKTKKKSVTKEAEAKAAVKDEKGKKGLGRVAASEPARP